MSMVTPNTSRRPSISSDRAADQPAHAAVRTHDAELAFLHAAAGRAQHHARREAHALAVVGVDDA